MSKRVLIRVALHDLEDEDMEMIANFDVAIRHRDREHDRILIITTGVSNCDFKSAEREANVRIN
jgi:hypothetical protein